MWYSNNIQTTKSVRQVNFSQKSQKFFQTYFHNWSQKPIFSICSNWRPVFIGYLFGSGPSINFSWNNGHLFGLSAKLSFGCLISYLLFSSLKGQFFFVRHFNFSKYLYKKIFITLNTSHKNFRKDVYYQDQCLLEK